MAQEGLAFLDQLQTEFNLANGQKLPNYVLSDVANRIFMFSNCNLEPLNIDEVAKQFGFTYFEGTFHSENIRAILGIDKKYKNVNADGMVLKVKESETPEDKLVLATYVLSNFILNSKSRSMYYGLVNVDGVYNDDVMRFCRCLLMEEKVFSSAFKQEQDKAKTDQQLVGNLAKRFSLPEFIVQERIDDLKLN